MKIEINIDIDKVVNEIDIFCYKIKYIINENYNIEFIPKVKIMNNHDDKEKFDAIFIVYSTEEKIIELYIHPAIQCLLRYTNIINDKMFISYLKSLLCHELGHFITFELDNKNNTEYMINNFVVCEQNELFVNFIAHKLIELTNENNIFINEFINDNL